MKILESVYGSILPLAAVGIKFVGVPQPKPMHRFSPNFWDMFTPRGSKAD